MTLPSYTEIVYELDGAAAIITIDRPRQLNAFTTITLAEIHDALGKAMRDTRVVGAVVTGAGKAFCVGLDAASLAETAAHPPDLDAVPQGELALFSYIRDLPKPVVAAVNGTCAGGGFVLALMCDLRFASEEASFITVFSRRGLIAEHGTNWLLPRLVGTGRALDLLLSSRRVGGAEAVAIGLAEHGAEPAAVVMAAAAYINELAKSTSPRSLRVIKELINGYWGSTFEDAVKAGHGETMLSLTTPDFAEGVESFLQHRDPQFSRIGVDPDEA